MPAPWTGGAQGRIIGELHGQQTVNVLHFATNSLMSPPAQLDLILLQLAQALLDCVITTLLPAVSIDWKVTHCDAKRIAPAFSDPVIATAPANSVGDLSVTSVSFSSSLISLRTGIDGRKGRGRMFLPPPGEAEVAQSAMDNPTLVKLTAFATCLAGKFLGATPTTDWRLGVLSRKDYAGVFGNFDNAFRVVTQLSPKSELAVLRSRRRGHGA
jgi:hypothetical protein